MVSVAGVGVGAETRRPAGPLAALLGVTLVGLVVTAPALASPSEADLHAARDLFADAEKDEDAGRWSDARDKLRRVADVKLTSGVRYHLALCDEHLGHLVAAYDGFTAAQAQAKADGAQDVLRLLAKHLEDLGPRVPHLTVHVLPATASATVKLDGNVLPAASVGVPMPLDPGPHTLEASAPPMTPASAKVTLQERDVTSLDLTLGEPPPPPPSRQPPRTPAPAPASTPTPTPAPAPATPGNSHVGAILSTAGAVALAGFGIAAFVLAGNAVTSGQQQCASSHAPGCDSEKNTVRTWDWLAASTWVGAAGLGTLAVVLWTQGGASGPSAALSVGPGSASVRGQF